MRRPILLLLLIVATATGYSQTAAFNGVCFSGGRSAVVQGLSSSNKLDGIIPSCRVEVFLTGTTTHATIYADLSNTPLSNPFTADTLTAAAPGKWLFYAATGQAYDVTMSGGIPPNTYLLPVTLTGLQVSSGGGGGGLTFFSAGDFSPLFNTNVSNPGTTPNLSFSAISQPAQTMFGNFTGVSGAPFFGKYTCTGLLNCTYDPPSNTLNFNVPTTSSLSITATSPIRVNGGAGPVSSGTANIDCPDCGKPNIRMFPIGQDSTHVFIPFGTCSPSSSGVVAYNYCDATSGNAANYRGGIFGYGAVAQQNYTGAVLPSWLPAANVSDVKLVAYTSGVGSVTSDCTGGVTCGSWNFPPSNGQVTVPIVGATGSNISSITARINLTNGPLCIACPSPFTLVGELFVQQVGLLVGFTGVTAPQDNYINTDWPLTFGNTYYGSGVRTLNLSVYYPNYISPLLVQNLPSVGTGAGPYTIPYPDNFEWFVSDNTQTTIGGPCTGSGTAGDGFAIVKFSLGNCTLLQILGTGGSGGGINQLTGDVLAGPGSGSQATTLATVNSSPGTCGDATHVCQITTNGKGLTTTQTAVAITGGGGTIGGSGTAGYYALWSASTTLGNGSLDDGVSNAGFLTSTKPVKVVCTGCPTQIDLTYNAGHAPVGTAGSVSIAPDTSGNLTASPNGGSYTPVPPLASGFVSGHCGQPTSSGGVWTIADSGAACGSGGGGGTPAGSNGVGQINASGSFGASNIFYSQTADTIASINTQCTGGSTYVADVALTISTGGTINSGCKVDFRAGGVWTVASGQTVTFATAFSSDLSQHFAGAGSVAFSTAQPTCSPEWFGGAGDWNGTTGTANDTALASCVSALQAGQIILQSRGYKVTGPLSITKSNVGISGTAAGYPYSAGAQVPSYLISTSSTADVVDVSNTLWNKFENFAIDRSVVPGGTSAGLSFSNTCGVTVNQLQSNDSIRDIYVNGFASCGVGGFFSVSTGWAYTGLTYTGSSSVYGFYVNTAAVNPSLRMSNVTSTIANASAIGTWTTYGFYTTGGLIQDYMVRNFETAYLSHGIYINGGGVGSQDLHFDHPILDNCLVDCIYVTGTTAAVAPSIQFDGGWAIGVSSNTGNIIDIESSQGVIVTGMQVGSVSGATLVYVNGSRGITVNNNLLLSAFATGIQLNNSTNSVVQGNFGSPTGATTILKLTGSTYNTISGNNFRGTATTGLSLDATSSNNNATDLNTFATTITTPVSDSGTSNFLSIPLAHVSAGTAQTGTWDFSGATQFKLPVATGYASAANGELGYDSTNNNWHIWANAGDKILAPLASGFVSGHCGQPTQTGSSWTIVDAGAACGTGGGGSAFSSITSGTNTTATMTVGSGGAMNTSGTGTIVATSLTTSFPWTVIQEDNYYTTSLATSITFTFPQALQSSGATAWMIGVADGTQTFNACSGWTTDLSYTGAGTSARIVVMHVASASQTSCTLTTSSNTAVAFYFFEISGTHTFGTSSTAHGTSLFKFPGLSITPSSGAVVFSIAGITVNNTPDPVVNPLLSPNWKPFWVGSPAGVSRVTFGIMATTPATGSAITPPPFNVAPTTTYYTLTDAPYATFSIN